jgi:hypothetical protein
LENQLTVGSAVTYPKWFKVVFYQISIVVTIENFDLNQVPLCLLEHQLSVLASPCCLKVEAFLGTLMLITTLASTSWARLVFLGDFASVFTLGMC